MLCAILIPCYEPDERVIELFNELRIKLHEHNMQADFYAVNDGSGGQYAPIFNELEEMDVCVISYAQNHGKGYALRTGIAEICRAEEEYDYIITADADGQHSPEAIADVAEAAMTTGWSFQAEGAAYAGLAAGSVAAAGDLANGNMRDPTWEEYAEGKAPLIIGVRDFSSPDIPARSRFGNRFSALYFKYVTGVSLQDTQSGLRAIPARMFNLALKTPGDRYDYEMNFLMAAAKERDAIRAVPIEAIYQSNNSGSHFRTVRDSVLIYRTPLRYIASSLGSAVVDLSLFWLLTRFFGTLAGGILLATIFARIASGIVNFTVNRKWSFAQARASEGRAWWQALKYLILFISQMLASAGLVALLRLMPIPVTLVKMLVDTCLAFVSYYVQHNWVFTDQKPGGGSDMHAAGSGAILTDVRKRSMYHEAQTYKVV